MFVLHYFSILETEDSSFLLLLPLLTIEEVGGIGLCLCFELLLRCS